MIKTVYNKVHEDGGLNEKITIKMIKSYNKGYMWVISYCDICEVYNSAFEYTQNEMGFFYRNLPADLFRHLAYIIEDSYRKA